jgi:Sulfatase
MLPHVPWQYFPSGTQYNANGIGYFGVDGLTKNEWWLKDPNVIQLALKRHQLQVEFVDRLFGEFIDHLDQIDLFDRSLIVVLADHGTSFQPGSRRVATVQNYEDVIRIPFFIKRPFQIKGRTADVNAQTIDILPTILQILKIRCNWKLDGRSLLDRSEIPRTKVIYAGGGKLQLPSRPETISGFVDMKEIDSKPDWIGKQLSELREIGKSPLQVHLHNAESFTNVDTKSGFVPALVTAHMEASSIPEDVLFGVVVNGILQTAAHPFHYNDQKQFLSCVVPESSFKSGANDVEIVLIPKNAGNEFMRPEMIRETGQPVTY